MATVGLCGADLKSEAKPDASIIQSFIVPCQAGVGTVLEIQADVVALIDPITDLKGAVKQDIRTETFVVGAR